MDMPNVVTLLILTVLTNITQIPIQSIYPGLSAHDLNDKSNHAYKYLSRIFYPSGNQAQDSERAMKPIIILWSCNKANDMLCPVPLFPVNMQVSSSSSFVFKWYPLIIHAILFFRINLDQPLLSAQ